MDDFGGKLRQARERRGVSLRQIAASTRISAAALDALERNDISKLPGGIFSRAFVRSYAVEVGLDPDRTVQEFLERFNQEAAPTAESVAAAVPEAEAAFEHRRRIAGVAVSVAGVAIAVAVVVALFALRGRILPRNFSLTRAAEPPAPAAAEPPPQSSPAAAVPAPSVVPPQNTPGAAPAVPADAVPAGQLLLDVHPTSDCWVSLTVDGKRVFGRVMRAGERESHAVEREAVVEIGDAGAFAFAVNGHEGKPLGDKGQVKTLKLTPATAAQYVQ